ncbi:MAG: hypothetical protein GX297_07070 [Treponema sp.]|nr:hypothetical protein [Treponema sp.]
MLNNIPIVFCHGLLGWKNESENGLHYFVAVEKLKKQEQGNLPRFIFSSTGPISSLHDQACELFFQLKGGLTDYGEEHSKNAGHKRYSRQYDNPEYPQWNSENPLHFVGHSMGAPLIRLLQYYLAEDYFYKNCGFQEHTSSDWIVSITTIAGVHNGSTLTWILGADENTGLLKKDAKFIRFLSKFIEVIGKYQNKQKNKNFVFDLHLDQWDIENTQKIGNTISNLSSKINFEGTDWAMYDLTPNSLSIYNSFIKEYKDTYYFSCKLSASFSLFGLIHLPIPFVARNFFFLNIIAMGLYKVKNSKWKKIEKLFHKNDGMCPTESQGYPFLSRTDNNYVYYELNKDIPVKGKWNVLKNIPAMDHGELAMIPHFSKLKNNITFYKNLIQMLANLDLRKEK